MSRYQATAELLGGEALILEVRGQSGACYFSDQLAVSPETWRTLADKRLAHAGWRVSEWRQDGDRWVADVEPVVS